VQLDKDYNNNNNMTAFFGVGGNPFATPVGQKIEQATDASLASENWALNMEICDIINETEDGAKDAMKAIRKRLQLAAGKNYTVVMYTLTVLETCVKNCDRKFHVLACNKEFISELVKLIGPKNEPPSAVQEKVLSLIQSWADAFHQHSELNGVVQVYQELKTKGIEFPMTDLDAMAPIHTPQKVVRESKVDMSTVDSGSHSPSASSAAVNSSSVTPEQMTKLKADLDILQTNMTVFGEMINELTPGNEHPADLQLLQELHATLLKMQERLVELISRLASDDFTGDLLRINDHLNNLFLRYRRFEKNREASKDPEGSPLSNGAQASLIDLDNEAATAAAPVPTLSQITSKMSNIDLGSQLASLSTVPAQSNLTSKAEREDSEFDMFAQSRNVTYESSKLGGSTYESNRKPDQISGSLGAAAEARAAHGTPATTMHKESDFDEMAAWLGEAGNTEESLTSSEFERFLAERAAAADALPTQQSPRRNPPSGKDPQDSSLFAL